MPEDDDPLLTVAEVCLLLDPPMSPGDFRSRVARGRAPEPDDRSDVGAANRSTPRWLTSTIKRYNVGRNVRSNLPGSISPEVVKVPTGSITRPWAVVDRTTGQILARGRSRLEAVRCYERKRVP
jgi:hypothetical protein